MGRADAFARQWWTQWLTPWSVVWWSGCLAIWSTPDALCASGAGCALGEKGRLAVAVVVVLVEAFVEHVG